MKTVLRVAAPVLLAASLASAEPDAPGSTPQPSPVAQASPSPAPAKAVKPPALRNVIDSLSDGDAKQALDLLHSNYVRSTGLDESSLNRATLQGLLERLGGGASIRPATTAPEADSPFRSEILDEQIGYVRFGSLTKGHLAEFDAALGNFKTKKIESLILDLRATPSNSDFELAAEVVKRLTPKGKMLFAVHRPSVKQERMYTSDRDPVFQGVTVTLIHRETAGAPEVIAAVLRAVDHSLAVGQRTSGQAAEFVELPLRGGKVLRVAIAEVKLPQDFAVFPDGLKPDLPVEVSGRDEEEVLKIGLEKGVGGLVYETERARMNEAALVAGTNPEIDAEEAAQQGGDTQEEAPLFDTVLQRAVDLVTTIRLIGGKAP
ncbi:MAG: S41 family peptidase [Verrucomicrobia bacterium]|nr:S41 family peptidase [Verrucomicrobiota bacterium]